jgi:hypothetical protein
LPLAQPGTPFLKEKEGKQRGAPKALSKKGAERTSFAQHPNFPASQLLKFPLFKLREIFS